MKRIFKIIGIIILSIVILIIGYISYIFISASSKSKARLATLGNEAPTISIDNFTFRDLNKNGKLDIYEDKRQSVEARTTDLLSQMNLEEKAGLLFITVINTNSKGILAETPELSNPFSFIFPPNSLMIVDKKMNSFNLLSTPPARQLTQWVNAIQKVAERTRLGIPITLASDPRNHFMNNEFASLLSSEFSLWPEPIGLAATGDSVLVKEFANIARQEYRAAGIQLALHPMADLATEPRWPRINGTFGEDAHLASKLIYAYIKGFQGDSLSSESVACMVKHFSGGGPQKEGLDPHFQFQQGQVYPGNNFNYHLIPFEEAFKAGVAQVMPYYGVPMNQTSENVGFAFNKEIITGLLRDKYHFEGVICTDWGIITDIDNFFIKKPAAAHGVMNLSREERLLKVINAGCDMIGGESIPEMLVKLVKEGKVTEQRLDISVKRVLRDKFRLGLFENPYLDEETAVNTIGKKEFRDKGIEAQRRSLVLLKNGKIKEQNTLPLSKSVKIYSQGYDKAVVAKYATVVEKPEEADFAIIKLFTPYEPRKGFMESLFHHGDLDFKGKQKEDILALLKKVPTIVTIYLERPAVIPEISAESAALIGYFGASDEVIFDAIFGKYDFSGKLPFELPSSMEAVHNQFEDVPYDSKNPLYPFGFGLSIKTESENIKSEPSQ